MSFNLDVEEKECKENRNKFVDEKLDVRLDKDPFQLLHKLAELLDAT